MKKRMLAMILAGLLTMSAVACKTTSENPNTTTATTTTAPPTVTTTSPSDYDDPDDPYAEINETVYALEEAPLFASPNYEDVIEDKTVPFKSTVTLIKQNTTWSVIKYEDVEYYTPNEYLTDEDIVCATIESISEQEVYITEDGYSIRYYPTTLKKVNNKSNAIDKKTVKGDSVWAVGKSKNWYQVKLTQDATETYFISSECISETNTTLTSDWKSNYPYTDVTTDYYIIDTDALNLRYEPNPSADLADTLKQKTKVEVEGVEIEEYTRVKVTTIATVSYTNGTTARWAQILIYPNGDTTKSPQRLYANAKFLSTGTVESLDSLLEENPLFVKCEEQVMYVDSETGNLNLRYKPIVPELEEGENDPYIAKTIKSKTEVKVVAVDSSNNPSWYIVCYDNGFYFASADHLTPHGEDKNYLPLLSLNEAMKLHNSFAETAKTLTVKQSIEYYSTPDYDLLFDSDADNNPIVMGTLGVGDTAIVVAEGGPIKGYDYYIIRHNGGCYFIVNDSNNVEEKPSTNA